MKKILIVVAIIIVVLISKEENEIIIPNNAIRFRVVANSNTLEDQSIKNNIAKYIESYVIDLTSDAKSSEEAKDILLSNHKTIENEVENYMVMNNIKMNYEVSIGRNYFPSKNYRGVKYDAGFYDSIVLNLGNKQGINWWCVMYPPLCLADRDTKSTDVEYTTLTKEILDKYTK